MLLNSFVSIYVSINFIDTVERFQNEKIKFNLYTTEILILNIKNDRFNMKYDYYYLINQVTHEPTKRGL